MTGPSTPSPAYTAMALRWSLVTALRGGTFAMRQAGEQFLPRHPKEEVEDYRIRLENSYLSPYLDTAITSLSGRAFSQPWTVDTGLPSEWIEDVDLAGNHVEQFARAVLEDSQTYGLSHILADAPPAEQDGVRTLADDRNEGRRPYLSHIPARNVIGWRSEQRAGKDVLTQVRIRETAEVPDGRWSTKTVERVRVLEPGQYEIYEGPDRVGGGSTGRDYIPLVTHYSRRVGYMQGLPPFEALGFLNQRHWVSTSDQNHVLHICRVPIIKGTGLTDQDEITIGPNSFVRLPRDADLSYVVMDSGGINAGYQDLDRLEMQCRLLGMQPLLLNGGDRTATEASIAHGNTTVSLKASVLALKDSLELALGHMADLAGLRRDVGGTLQVNTDFGVKGDPLEMQNLIVLYQQGVVTKRTLLLEAKRRGLLDDDLDVDAEVAVTDTAAPDLVGEALELA